MQTGIVPLSPNDKAKNAPYAVGALLSLPPLSEIPNRWVADVPIEWTLNQTEYDPLNDECAGCAAAIVSGIQEGEALDPHFHWMMTRQATGAKESDFGVSNRDIADTLRKIGSLSREESPKTFKNPRNEVADPTKWDIAGLLPKAKKRIKGSIVWVTAQGGYDAFDMYRAAVTKFNKLYGKPHGCVFGMLYNYDGEYINDVVSSGTGHDVAIIGWDGEYAIMVNSLGLSEGNRGRFKIHRNVFNKWAEYYGAFIPIDATAEQVKYAVESGTKLDDPWHTQIIKSFLAALIDLKRQLLVKITTGAVPPYRWDTPEHARYNVRHICDDMGLSFAEKNLICACIYQESGFNNAAKGVNKGKNGDILSTDWGICQVNDYWHCGAGKTFPSAEYVVEHPEEAVRWMIKMYKLGQLKLWVSFSSGAYKKWLAQESRPGIVY